MKSTFLPVAALAGVTPKEKPLLEAAGFDEVLAPACVEGTAPNRPGPWEPKPPNNEGAEAAAEPVVAQSTDTAGAATAAQPRSSCSSPAAAVLLASSGPFGGEPAGTVLLLAGVLVRKPLQ